MDSGIVANLDAFAAAQSIAEDQGATTTSWASKPAMGLQLATLNADDGSNLPLLQADPRLPTRRQVILSPLFISLAVPADTIYGVPEEFS